MALPGMSHRIPPGHRPCNLEFPQDHAPHPGFRTEWWYWTGNLGSETGRHFGYQLTIFRYQLTLRRHSRMAGPSLGLAHRQIYIAMPQYLTSRPALPPG
jgi:predicted secreted hydrolase